MAEIHPADPATRRRARVLVVAIAAAGVAGYFILEDWLAGIRAAEPVEAKRTLSNALIWGSWLASLPVLVFAIYLWVTGDRVRQTERFPLPGAKLARDTPILTGPAARTRGTVLQVLGVLLCLFTFGLLFAVYRLRGLLDQAQ